MSLPFDFYYSRTKENLQRINSCRIEFCTFSLLMEAYLSRINFSNRSTTRAWTVSKMIANVWSDIVGTSKKIRYSFVFARARWKQMTMYIPRIDDESVFAHLFRGDTCPIFQHVNVRKYPRIFVKTFHTNFFLEMRIETRRIIDVPSIHVSFTIAILSIILLLSLYLDYTLSLLHHTQRSPRFLLQSFPINEKAPLTNSNFHNQNCDHDL